MPKYPHIGYEMPRKNEPDGNAYVILGQVQRLMRDAGISKKEVKQFIEEATSGDYENLRSTVASYVEVR